jgi:hypothetical protein
MGTRKQLHPARTTVTCALCGATRDVRSVLVASYDALVCQSHPWASEISGLEIPPGHVLVHEVSTIAGWFSGYRIEVLGPGERRALHRARTLAAFAIGQPAPEPDFDPDDTSWVDKRLMAVLTERLGSHGWEIADFAVQSGRYDVKVYTDWGWAGFLSGTPKQIAHELDAIRTQWERAIRGAKSSRQG